MTGRKPWKSSPREGIHSLLVENVVMNRLGEGLLEVVRRERRGLGYVISKGPFHHGIM